MEEITEKKDENLIRIYEQHTKSMIEILNSALEEIGSDFRVHLLPVEKT